MNLTANGMIGLAEAEKIAMFWRAGWPHPAPDRAQRDKRREEKSQYPEDRIPRCEGRGQSTE